MSAREGDLAMVMALLEDAADVIRRDMARDYDRSFRPIQPGDPLPERRAEPATHVRPLALAVAAEGRGKWQ